MRGAAPLMRPVAGFALGLLAALCTAILLPAGKLVAGRLQPDLLAGAVWALAGLFLSLSLLRRSRAAAAPGPRDLVALALAGTLAPVLAMRGLALTHAGVALVIVAALAAAVPLLATLARRPGARAGLALLLALASAAAAAAPFWPDDLTGPLLIAAGAGLWGLSAWLAPGAMATAAAGPVWLAGGLALIAWGFATGAWWPMEFDLVLAAILGATLAGSVALARRAGPAAAWPMLAAVPAGVALASGPLGEPRPVSLLVGLGLLLAGLLLHPGLRRASPPWAT